MLNPTLFMLSKGITDKIANSFAVFIHFISKHSHLAIPHFIHSRSRISYFTYTSGQIFKSFYL